MSPQFLRAIAYRWHLGMNTANIAKAIGKPECEIYNRLPEARQAYPRSAFPMLETMLGSVVTR